MANMFQDFFRVLGCILLLIVTILLLTGCASSSSTEGLAEAPSCRGATFPINTPSPHKIPTVLNSTKSQ